MITKSDLITRDIDVYKSITSHSPVIIKLTITTPRDELSKVIEPYASSSSKRFEAVKKMFRQGTVHGGIDVADSAVYHR